MITRFRQCMTLMDTPKDINIKRCIELRKQSLIIRTPGQLEFVCNQNQALTYRKYQEEGSVYYYINNHSEKIVLLAVDEL